MALKLFFNPNVVHAETAVPSLLSKHRSIPRQQFTVVERSYHSEEEMRSTFQDIQQRRTDGTVI